MREYSIGYALYPEEEEEEEERPDIKSRFLLYHTLVFLYVTLCAYLRVTSWLKNNHSFIDISI